jgi:hypothetical protein
MIAEASTKRFSRSSAVIDRRDKGKGEKRKPRPGEISQAGALRANVSLRSCT